MKKLSLFLVAVGITVFSITSVKAQNKGVTGLSAGYNSVKFNLKAEFEGESESDSESFGGFYVGLFHEVLLSEKTNLHVELQYAQMNEDNDSSAFLNIPIMLKYYVDEKLSLHVGPQFDFLLEKEAEGINKFGIGLGIGLGYDISEKVFISTRYSLGFTERIDGDLDFDEVDLGIKFDTFQIGLGYNF